MKPLQRIIVVVVATLFLASCSGNVPATPSSSSSPLPDSGAPATTVTLSASTASENSTSGPSAQAESDLVVLYQSEKIDQFEPFKDSSGNMQDPAANIRVPQVLIDSPDAQAFNEEMRDYAEYLLITHELERDSSAGLIARTDYSFTIERGVLSIRIEKNILINEILSYSSFNVDIKTGKELSAQELLARFGIGEDYGERALRGVFDNQEQSFSGALPARDEFICSDDSILGDAVSGIKIRLSGADNPRVHPSNYQLISEVLQSLDGRIVGNLNPYQPHRYWPQYESMCPKQPFVVFVDESGEPAFMIPDLQDFDRFGSFKAIQFAEHEPYRPELNPDYVAYAKLAGIDPQTGPLVLSAFLGYAGDADAVRAKVAHYFETTDAKYANVLNPYEGAEWVGDENYLIIPKWKDTLLSFFTDEPMSESVQSERYFAANLTSSVFVVCNVSELVGDMVIRIDLDEEYSPGVSLMDESNFIDSDAVADITEFVGAGGETESEKVRRVFDLLYWFQPKG